MKYFLILLCFFVFQTNSFAKHISWKSEYEKQLIEAKKQNKNILLLLLDKNSSKDIFINVFSDEKIIDQMQNFIAIIAYFEHKNSYPIELFYTQSFPAVFFVSYEDESYLTKPLFGKISNS